MTNKNLFKSIVGMFTPKADAAVGIIRGPVPSSGPDSDLTIKKEPANVGLRVLLMIINSVAYGLVVGEGIGDGVGHGFSGSSGDGHGVGELVGDGRGVGVWAARVSESLPVAKLPAEMPANKNATLRVTRARFFNIRYLPCLCVSDC